MLRSIVGIMIKLPINKDNSALLNSTDNNTYYIPHFYRFSVDFDVTSLFIDDDPSDVVVIPIVWHKPANIRSSWIRFRAKRRKREVQITLLNMKLCTLTKRQEYSQGPNRLYLAVAG